MLHASELRFVHPVSHEPMHSSRRACFDRPRRESPGLPHQIVGHLKVGVRIVFILLILTQGAVQHDAAGVALGNFLSHYRRNNRIFTFGLVIHRQAGNRQTAVNSWVWVGLSTDDFFDQIIIGKVKPISPRATVMRFISISCFTWALYSFRQHRLLLLLAKLFITLQLGFLFFFHRFPGLTGLNAGFFRRPLDFSHFFAADQAGFEHLLL